MIFGIYRLFNPSVQIEWTTESEVDTLGFNLMRADHSFPEDSQKITPQLIMAWGSPIAGEKYQFVDTNVKAGKSYIYHLQEITYSNETVVLESINVEVRYQGLLEIMIAIGFLVVSVLITQTEQKTLQVKQDEKLHF